MDLVSFCFSVVIGLAIVVRSGGSDVTIPTCLGQNVTLSEGPFSADAAQGQSQPGDVLSVEWLKTDGHTDVLLAVNTSGHFFPLPRIRRALEFVPNKGVQISVVRRDDLGLYKRRVSMHGKLDRQTETAMVVQQDELQISGDQLKVYVKDDVIYDASSQQWHVQLVCGRFLSGDDVTVSVQWETPSKRHLDSSTIESGNAVLHVPNPVEDGVYTCVLKTHQCRDKYAGSGPAASLLLNGVEQRLRLLEASTSALQRANGTIGANATEHVEYEQQQYCRHADALVQAVIQGQTYALAFRLTPYIGQSAYDVYVDEGNNDDDPLVRATMPIGCLSVDGRQPCDRHYRSKILDLWKKLPIEKVRVSAYENGSEVMYFEFEAADTDYINWFEKNKAINTSYADFLTEPTNYCSIAGGADYRRFHINRNYGGCASDAGWLVVTDKNEPCRPTWGPPSPHPVISYMDSSTHHRWSSDYVRQADVLAIWVKMAASEPQK